MLLLRHRLVAVAVLGACFLMAITAGISLATTLATVSVPHASAFAGSNNNPAGATKDTGYLFATSGSAGQVQADGNYLEFTQAALDWIRANEAGFYGPQEFKIAFVHHAFVADSNGVYAYAIAVSHERVMDRSEEHTSELQSPDHLVCRLLLEKKNR